MKKPFRSLLAALASLALVLFLPIPQAWGQAAKGRVKVPLFQNQNFTSTTFTYCASVTPATGNVLDTPGTRLPGPATTSGSSTTVTSFTLGTGVFSLVSVGDILLFNLSGTGTQGVWNPPPAVSGLLERVVSAKASSDSITVDAAIDLSGATTGAVSKFGGYWPYWRQVRCGTTNNDGWVPVSNMQAMNFVLDLNSATSLVGGVNYNLQCILASHNNNPETLLGPVNVASGSLPTVVNFAPQGNTATPWDYCRVGVQIGTSVTSTSFNGLFSGVWGAE